MNYLQLCKRVHLLLRTGEDAPGTAPTTVTGQVGVPAEIVQWVAASHEDICRLHTDWSFMRGEGELPVPSGARIIAKSAIEVVLPEMGKLVPLARGNDEAFILLAPDSAPEQQIEVLYVPNSRWYGTHDRLPLSTDMPRYFTVNPTGGIEFNTIADRDYTARVMYRKVITALDSDADEPMMDSDYHLTIVQWAIVHYYCASRGDIKELREKHDLILRRELTKLRNEQLPDFLIY